MVRKVDGWVDLNPNIRTPRVLDIDDSLIGVGVVPSAVAGTVTATEKGDGVFHQTVLTLTAMPMTVRDVEQGGGAQIYTFPAGRICRLGAIASIAVTTTSALAGSMHAGVTGNWGVGSTTQISVTVATTEQDFVNVTAFTSSATVNVAGAVANGVGAGVLASLDGTGTNVAAFLNLAVVAAGDVTGDATVTVSGTVTITWANLGDQ